MQGAGSRWERRESQSPIRTQRFNTVSDRPARAPVTRARDALSWEAAFSALSPFREGPGAHHSSSSLMRSLLLNLQTTGSTKTNTIQMRHERRGNQNARAEAGLPSAGTTIRAVTRVGHLKS